MRKIDAIHYIADGNTSIAAKELGVSRPTVYNWPDILDQPKIDLVNGVLWRLNKKHLMFNERASDD